MARKSNIRSIRFSDELAQMIDLQPGRNFTEKFEYLITKCCWEIPGKETELERLNRQITEKRQELRILSDRAAAYSRHLTAIGQNIIKLEDEIKP